MAGNILRGTGKVMLNLVKGLFYAVLMLLKLLAGCLKVFLLLFSLVARIVFSVVGIALQD